MAVEIFYSYAHEDENLRQQLEKHLLLLQRQGLVTSWHDRSIGAGSQWINQIDSQLNSANIILLLISPDFLASDYCYDIEMQRALERHETGEAQVIPILLRPCRWEETPFSSLQVLPSNAMPISMWPSQDAAFLDITRSLHKVITNTPINIATIPTSKMPKAIEFTVQQGDITQFDADVVALKYAQDFYGADEHVAFNLTKVGISEDYLRPQIGEYKYVQTKGAIAARNALFVGVPDLIDFGYEQIRTLATQVLNILANAAPHTRQLAMTIHGVGFGLDEVEAILAQFAGYMDALQSGKFPSMLESITIVDIGEGRVQRLRQVLDNNLADATYASKKLGHKWAYNLTTRPPSIISGHVNLNKSLDSTRTIENAGLASSPKPHAFIAMPFKEEMDDIFYFGIQQPVRDAGFLCERIDQTVFTGDVLERVKTKIETASVVIAELTGANPNVYLELGYAWGKGRPAILLVKDGEELRFDVRGHRCLKYKSIRNLKETLDKELSELQKQGLI